MSKGGLVSADQFKSVDHSKSYCLDVRGVAERVNGYWDVSDCIPLDQLQQTLKAGSHSIPNDKPIYVYCRSGARGTAALSMLKNHGFNEVINIDGGIIAMIEAKLDVKYAKCSRSGK